jgi:hypothetical protein
MAIYDIHTWLSHLTTAVGVISRWPGRNKGEEGQGVNGGNLCANLDRRCKLLRSAVEAIVLESSLY